MAVSDGRQTLAVAQPMYSQNDEEQLILEAVGDRKEGCVCEIGAYDGKTNSNSLALIERGWKALLVEPAPEPFIRLLALHAGNPNVMLLNAAVGTESRITPFYDAGYDQIGTTQPSAMEKYLAAGKAYSKYWVPMVTPSQIVAQLGGGADVLSVDTEGNSFEVMVACPIDSWSPRVIIVEHDERIVEIGGWGRSKGYRVAGLNAENLVLRR